MSKVTQLMPERAGVETRVCLAPGAREEGPTSERGLTLPVSFRTAPRCFKAGLITPFE